MGLYDIMNEDFNEKDFKAGPAGEPVIRVQGMHQDMEGVEEESSSEDGSDDSNLYYQFDSDDDQGEASSFTTKSTND